MRKILLICAIILFAPSYLFAHQDTIIEIKGTKLIGLPEKYQPAELDLGKKILKIANKQIVFPDCLIEYLPINNSDAQLRASWYHDKRSGLPPYFVITKLSRDKPIKYSVSFNMNTLELISITEITKNNSNKYRYAPIKIDECKISSE